jgi:hypothetical protein
VRRLPVLAAALLVAALLVAGCGIQPSGVTEVGDAPPTGVAAGVTLYLVDDEHHLVPDQRETGQLGTTVEALALLLAVSDQPELHTEIRDTSVTRVFVQIVPGLITLRVPLTRSDMTATGVDQIVCTAIASVVQAGASRATKVNIQFTEAPAADQQSLRTCPVIK